MSAERDELVRRIVERRLAQVMAPRAEAQACMAVLTERGFTQNSIAERCGVFPNAVSAWKCGLSAPKTVTAWAGLASLTRRALAMNPREERYTGMGRVIAGLMVAHGISACEVARRAGIRWPQQYGGRWLRGVAKPNRANTVRLRTMAREAGLGPEILALCDARFAELKAQSRQANTARVARMELKRLRSPGTKATENAPMIESPKPARVAG